MKVLDILDAPWAIVPEKLIQIQELYLRHLRGEQVNIAVIEAQLGRQLKNEPQPYEVDRGVGIVQINGILAKRMDLFMEISGGSSYRTIARNLNAALDDPEAHSILLNVDSPGGEVDGVQELTNLIFSLRSKGKPIVALADGMAASAGYWVASAAQQIFASDQTTMLGSIGVIARHFDLSRAYEGRGIKVTEITAGKFKGLGSPYKPLDRESENLIQEILDQIYSVFVTGVARNRGVLVAKVLEDMADGREFIGERAVMAGLADGIKTREEIIADLNEQAALAQNRARLGAAAAARLQQLQLSN